MKENRLIHQNSSPKTAPASAPAAAPKPGLETDIEELNKHRTKAGTIGILKKLKKISGENDKSSPIDNILTQVVEDDFAPLIKINEQGEIIIKKKSSTITITRFPEVVCTEAESEYSGVRLTPKNSRIINNAIKQDDVDTAINTLKSVLERPKNQPITDFMKRKKKGEKVTITGKKGEFLLSKEDMELSITIKYGKVKYKYMRFAKIVSKKEAKEKAKEKAKAKAAHKEKFSPKATVVESNPVGIEGFTIGYKRVQIHIENGVTSQTFTILKPFNLKFKGDSNLLYLTDTVKVEGGKTKQLLKVIELLSDSYKEQIEDVLKEWGYIWSYKKNKTEMIIKKPHEIFNKKIGWHKKLRRELKKHFSTNNSFIGNVSRSITGGSKLYKYSREINNWKKFIDYYMAAVKTKKEKKVAAFLSKTPKKFKNLLVKLGEIANG